MKFLKLFVLISTLSLTLLPGAFAQNGSMQAPSNEPIVQGMAGQVEISPNPAMQEVVVAFTSNQYLNKTSNQIVFVMQGKFSKYPTAWSGPARILVSYGLLVVAPSPDQKQNPTLAFKFAETAFPASLKGWSTDSYTVYGIARYGETVALNRQQLDELETTGKYTKSAEWNMGSVANQASFTAPTASPSYLPVCTAGGQGSTACGADGCTVTCGTGFWSCCYGGTCRCISD